RQRLGEAHQRMSACILRRLQEKRESFGMLAAGLEALSPLGTLARGYGIVRSLPDRRVVRSATGVVPGTDVEVVLGDGSLECWVRAVKEGGPDGRGEH
ncbi:MAG: exodeoxyribonuclease VII large subunit, partial [Bacillota bacterium]